MGAPNISERPQRLMVNYSLGLCFGKYRYDTAVAVATLEVDYAVNQSEERVVLAHTDILAGIVNRTALTHDDVTGDAILTAPNLNA